MSSLHFLKEDLMGEQSLPLKTTTVISFRYHSEPAKGTATLKT